MQSRFLTKNTKISQNQALATESWDLDASARFQKNLKQQLGDMIQNYNQTPN